MALAEARAAWQRAASRCFVQEDAKRAPKLACCSSLAPFQEPELRPADAASGQEIPPGDFSRLDPEPVYCNLSTRSQWWMHLQQGYGNQSRLMDEKLTVMSDCDETSDLTEASQDFLVNETDFVIVDQTSAESVLSSQFLVKEEKFNSFDTCGTSIDGKKAHDGVKAVESTLGNYFDPESCEKSGPWWQSADAEELAFLVAQRSRGMIENCDLPSPLTACGKTSRSSETISSCRHRTFTLSRHQDLVQSPSHLRFSDPLTADVAGQSAYPARRSPSESAYCSAPGDVGRMDSDTSQILDALHHSQTRARESDNIAKQACEEKEHIIKLVLRQASHLFAYKQWLRLLQLENNTYLLALRSKGQRAFPGSPLLPPWKPMRRRSRINTSRRKPDDRSGRCCGIGKYAVVFVVGLGLVGVGLMLGWGMAWMLLPGDRSSL